MLGCVSSIVYEIIYIFLLRLLIVDKGQCPATQHNAMRPDYRSCRVGSGRWTLALTVHSPETIYS